MTEIEVLVNIRKDGKLLLTSDKAALLKIIAKCGSLHLASKTLNMSYHKSWTMLEELNTGLHKPLVYKTRGGKGGGGALMTEFGAFILNEYVQIENQVLRFVNKINNEINR